MQINYLKLRKMTLFFLDMFLSVSSLYFAFLLRFDGDMPLIELFAFYELLPFVLIGRAVAFTYFGFYSRFWEYLSLEDLIQIIKAVVSGSLLILAAFFLYNRGFKIPRSAMFIDTVILIMLLSGSRLIWRLWRERKRTGLHLSKTIGTKVLILGAGHTGAHLLKYLHRFSSGYDVVGFIDKNPAKLNSNIMGVKVLGEEKYLPEIAQKHSIKEILIAVAGITSNELSNIINLCKKCDVKYKMVASVIDLSTEEVYVSKIRNLDIGDLLGREPVLLDLPSMKKMIHNKRIMVTGAGGSIGSELCSQVLEHEPSSLVMVDHGENYLFDLAASLATETWNTETHYIFCSITNRKKMETAFSRYKPHIVFHAAAHKHVPLMEENIDEAIINNVYGTKLTAEISNQFNVEKFVLVSTDKVVRANNIMGMTKKIAEKYIQSMVQNSKTQFITVRFGNVLGSNGSVVPLFQKQIQKGGPIAVTHPDMERYFMLISEAAQLILQATTIGEGGEVFLLEMGKPVKIVDLAHKMIQLSGYQSKEDVEIIFTGIRPGEKLREELVDINEFPVSTFHKKIKILKIEGSLEKSDLHTAVEELIQEAKEGNPQDARKLMLELMPRLSPPVELC